MSDERIDITVPDEALAGRAAAVRRLEAAHRLEQPDRVPAVALDNQFTCLARRKRTFGEYIRSPEDNLREQVLNLKWRLENIRDDTPIPTESVTFRPDLGSLRGVEFPMEIIWHQDGPPKCVHPLQSLGDIDRLSVPPPDGGLNKLYIEWYHRMGRAAERMDVRINGRPLRINATVSHGGGPIPSAFALAGANLFIWMHEDPVRVHRLMDIVTESHINCVRFFDRLAGRPADHPVWLGCDTGEMLSPKMFREFVVPYYQRVWREFPGPPRTFHMCGKIDHLLPIIADEMRITCLDGFGSVTDRHKLAECMAGRVVLHGGPALQMSDEAFKADCLAYIQTIGQRGYILHPGGDADPAAPLDRLAVAMVAASTQAAK